MLACVRRRRLLSGLPLLALAGKTHAPRETTSNPLFARSLNRSRAPLFLLQEKGYAFAEFRSIEEASNALALDGVVFRDDADNHHLKIRRPSNYDLATALMLGPTTPDPTIDTSHLHMCRTTVEDSPHKLFVGGLPCDWNEEQVKGLISQHGTIRSFNLVMDKSTGKSKVLNEPLMY